MKRKLYLMAVLFALCLSPGWTMGQESAPAPAFKEGDTWQYSFARKDQVASSTDDLQGTYEITFAQGNVKIYQLDGTQKTEIAIEPDGPTQNLINWIGKSTQQLDLKFPLSIGQKWTYDYTTASGRTNQRRSVEVTVVGTEKVTTSAGSYQAYKLVKTQSWTIGPRGGQGGNTRTYFYSPEAKSVVKSSTVNNNTAATVQGELVKFTPGN